MSGFPSHLSPSTMSKTFSPHKSAFLPSPAASELSLCLSVCVLNPTHLKDCCSVVLLRNSGLAHPVFGGGGQRHEACSCGVRGS